MDQGLNSTRYHLIPRVLIFLTRGDEVLLLRGAPTKRLWANLYNGIGGHVERGEDIYAAALRELAEETGLHPAHLAPPGLWLCGVLSVDTGEPTGIGVFIFRGVLAPASSHDDALRRHAPSPLRDTDPAQSTANAVPTLCVGTRDDSTRDDPSSRDDATPPPTIAYAQFAPSPEGTLEWHHPTHLADLPCLPDLLDLLPACLAHTPTQPPFFARSISGNDGLPVLTFA